MRECKMLWELIPQKLRIRLLLLLIATGFSSIFQLVGVGSIVPFMAVVTDPGLLAKWAWSSRLLDNLDSLDQQTLRVLLGAAVFIALSISSVITTGTNYFGQRVAADVNDTLARRLLAAYLSRSYSWYVQQNSAQLGRIVLSEVARVSNSFVVPLLGVIVQLGTACSLIAVLFIADPLIASISSLALGLSYLLVYRITRTWLEKVAKVRMNATGTRYKTVSEALQGFKTLKLLHCEEIFVDRFSESTAEENHARVTISMISTTPKQMIEVMVFAGIILIVLHLTAQGRPPESILPLLSLYGVCAMRLLPALQRTYAAISSIRANTPSVEVLYNDILDADSDEGKVLDNQTKLRMERHLKISHISFRYPETDSKVLNGIDIEIGKNSSVGFVGQTGAGKTTLIDILLGFLEPTEGSLLVDRVPISRSNVRSWQRNLGYVPQHIFIVDDTIRNNIAFGLNGQEIDEEQVIVAAKAAALHDFIVSELPDRYDTVVGEAGIRLSGGQRQRLGIARALYRDPEVLILDEATSALDGVTEVAVMEAIKSLSGTKTLIIIAHRLTTLQECDTIFLLDKGVVSSQGTYSELMDHNVQFQAFARASAETTNSTGVSGP